jgi:hypothetical protein
LDLPYASHISSLSWGYVMKQKEKKNDRQVR